VTGDRLARRYQTLLRFYPSDYRARRGAEMLDTYLMAAPPGRRRPTAADALDVVGGGLRARLRDRGAQSLLDALPVAGVLALSAAAFLGATWLLLVETYHGFPSDGTPRLGAFNSAAAVAWICWLIAAGIFAVAPRAIRPAVGVALLATFVAVPIERVIASMAPWDVAGFWYLPPVQVVLPQVALGLLALSAPVRPGQVVRWAPLAAASSALAFHFAPQELLDQLSFFYRSAAPKVFLGTALVLLGAGLAVAIVLGLRRDARAPWVPLLVLVPVGLLLAVWWARATSDYTPGHNAWPRLVLASTTSVVVTIGLLAATVVLVGRYGPRRARQGTQR
jgi:hypothetical protein